MNIYKLIVISTTLIISGSFSIAAHAQSTADEVNVIGKLVSVQASVGCGYNLVGSPATYDVQKGPADILGKQIVVLIPCIELSMGAGNVRHFNIGEMHDLVVTKQNIYKIEDPSSLPSGWFYLKSAYYAGLRPNNSFKPNPHRGGA